MHYQQYISRRDLFIWAIKLIPDSFAVPAALILGLYTTYVIYKICKLCTHSLYNIYTNDPKCVLQLFYHINI